MFRLKNRVFQVSGKSSFLKNAQKKPAFSKNVSDSSRLFGGSRGVGSKNGQNYIEVHKLWGSLMSEFFQGNLLKMPLEKVRMDVGFF